MLLMANDRFGLDLLKATHEGSPGRNIVLSPLPVSLAFAVLWNCGADVDSVREIGTACHWVGETHVPSAAKMILRRFEKPTPRPVPTKVPVGMSPAIVRMLLSGEQEEIWLSAAFLYRSVGLLSPDFVNRTTEEIGIPFRIVGEKTSQSAALARSWDRTAPMPRITGDHDFWITSATHLRTSWAGNTFVGSKREKSKFHLPAAADVSVDFLTTELWEYLYARTDQFEAVELPCKQATILLVLPAATIGMEQMEAIMASQPNLVEPRLARAAGKVTLPPFHFLFEAELRSSIEKLGVHRVFTDLRSLEPMAPGAGGLLTGVAQKTEITLDENGIRADSGTIASGIVGAKMEGLSEPFHMILDRPFLFFVRDNLTKALIFEGAVVNPALQ
jgi:serpin B